jgi:glycine/D-amino acid oxidase-like deaminating enzyme
VIEVDALIVGGGAQGLWLLRDLDKRGYRTVLLENNLLGGGQTCHSHALIHRGHYYDDIDMMIILNAAAQFWLAFLEDNEIAPLNTEGALAGFGPGTKVRLHEYMWRSAGLRFEQLDDVPPPLAGGRTRHVFATEEFSLDASHAVACLAAPLLHCIYRLDQGEGALTFELDGRRAVRVSARIDDRIVDIRPRYVILCAGQSNLRLLRDMGRGTNGRTRVPVQARRKSQMLVLRGQNLPPLTAVFPIRGGLRGVFICSRPPDDDGQRIWLVSDHNSTPFEPDDELVKDQAAAAPTGSWVRRILASLEETTPAVMSDLSSMEACLYSGLTSERNFGEGQHMTDCYVDPLDFDNVLTIWPTKLTLTPFASNVAMRTVRSRITVPSGPWPEIDRPIRGAPPPVAEETWTLDTFAGPASVKTPWQPWESFAEQWADRK